MSISDVIQLMGFGAMIFIATVIALTLFYRFVRWNEARSKQVRELPRPKPKKKRRRPVLVEHNPPAMYPGVTSRPLAERLVHADSVLSPAIAPAEASTSNSSSLRLATNDKTLSSVAIPNNALSMESKALVDRTGGKQQSEHYRVDIRLVSGETFENVDLMSIDDAPTEVTHALSIELRRESIAFTCRDGKTYVLHSSHVRWIVRSRSTSRFSETKTHGKEITRGTVG